LVYFEFSPMMVRVPNAPQPLAPTMRSARDSDATLSVDRISFARNRARMEM
jgi:hypothetical protein